MLLFLYIIVILWLLVIETGIFPNVKRGFYCDDRSISMRYNGETISTGAIISTIIFVYPILWICEACYFVPISLKSSRFIESATRAWRWFKEYLFGVILHLFVIDGLKVMCKNNQFLNWKLIYIDFAEMNEISGTLWWIASAFLRYMPTRCITNLHRRVRKHFARIYI